MLWFKFYFPLFWAMVMYDNEFKTFREIKFEPRIKLNHSIYSVCEVLRKTPKIMLLVWSFVFFMPIWVLPATNNLKLHKNTFFLILC